MPPTSPPPRSTPEAPPSLDLVGALPEPPAYDRTTTLAAFADHEHGEGSPRWPRLLAEATLFTGIGVALTRGLDIEQPGVLSIFLAAGALGSRAKQILLASDSGAGLGAARDLLAMFFGITLAYALTGIVLGPDETARDFAFALEAAGTGTEDLFSRRFPGALPLLGHNLTVLAAVVILSVVYRVYGALLALTWNACVWGLVVTSLALRATEVDASGAVLVAGLALLPHLTLEALAYVVGGLAGARLGRRLTMKANLRLPLRSFLVAGSILMLASLVEAHLPERVLRAVAPSSASAQLGR